MTRLSRSIALIAVSASCHPNANTPAKPAAMPVASETSRAFAMIDDKCSDCHLVSTDGRPILDAQHLNPTVAERAVIELLARRMPPKTSGVTLSDAERRGLLIWFCGRAEFDRSSCDAYADELNLHPRGPVPTTYQNLSTQLTGPPGELAKQIEGQLKMHRKPGTTSLILDSAYVTWASLLAAVNCQAKSAAAGSSAAGSGAPESVDDCVDQHLDVLFEYSDTTEPGNTDRSR